jgi:hypothetical protein
LEKGAQERKKTKLEKGAQLERADWQKKRSAGKKKLARKNLAGKKRRAGKKTELEAAGKNTLYNQKKTLLVKNRPARKSA